jgi:hypothetical protein
VDDELGRFLVEEVSDGVEVSEVDVLSGEGAGGEIGCVNVGGGEELVADESGGSGDPAEGFHDSVWAKW